MWSELTAEAKRPSSPRRASQRTRPCSRYHRRHALHGSGTHRPGRSSFRSLEGGGPGGNPGPLPQDARAFLYLQPAGHPGGDCEPAPCCLRSAWHKPELQEIAPHEGDISSGAQGVQARVLLRRRLARTRPFTTAAKLGAGALRPKARSSSKSRRRLPSSVRARASAWTDSAISSLKWRWSKCPTDEHKPRYT